MCVACMAFAVPAKKQWRTFTQSDGSTIELMLVGDENLHYYVTRDNVPVVSDGDNLFCYAKKAGFGIMSTGVLAHEATLRSANENVHVADVAEIESVRPYRKIKGVSGIRKLGEPDHPQYLGKKKGAASKPYKPISVPYTIEGEEEYNQMYQAHNAGYDTPISPFIRTRSRIYNPSAMPINSRFMANTNAKKNANIPLTWDWEQKGAGIAYFNLIHGYKTKNSDVIDFVKENNTEKISPDLSTGLTDFMHALRRRHIGNTDYNYSLPNYSQPTLVPEGERGLYNQSAADIEKALLQSITINSPNR